MIVVYDKVFVKYTEVWIVTIGITVRYLVKNIAIKLHENCLQVVLESVWLSLFLAKNKTFE